MEIYNGSQWAHDILVVNKADATEFITGRSYPMNTGKIMTREYHNIS